MERGIDTDACPKKSYCVLFFRISGNKDKLSQESCVFSEVRTNGIETTSIPGNSL
jgi:hypothetical protein